jgi:hypothetical protein
MRLHRAKLVKEFESELELLLQLKHHRNIVKVLAVVEPAAGQAAELSFILEHCTQGSLLDLLSADALPSLVVSDPDNNLCTAYVDYCQHVL